VIPHDSAEIYNPKKKTWSMAGSMASPRFAHTATLLPAGKVLVVGGFSDLCTGISTVEIYDSVTDTWAEAAPLAVPRGRHTAVLMSSGKVLIVGGQSNNCVTSSLGSAELYDPASGAWSNAGALIGARSQHIAVSLPGDVALVAGGLDAAGDGIASAELFYGADQLSKISPSIEKVDNQRLQLAEVRRR
jgi:hypothetical protein